MTPPRKGVIAYTCDTINVLWIVVDKSMALDRPNVVCYGIVGQFRPLENLNNVCNL
jgi:hypothetical protein